MTVFTLPDLGEGLQEAEIVAWHVAEGDHVIADQPLVSVETDKAVVEVPAPQSGTVARLLAAEGALVAVGAPLAEIDTGKPADTGAIVGELGPGPAPAKQPAREAAGKAAPPEAAVRASPAVRRLAREAGVDLASLAGSGPGGAILSADVRAAAEGAGPGEALRGVRRSMAKAMERSRASVVPATVTETADITAWPAGQEPTLRLIRAIAAAARAEPALNAWFDGARRTLHGHLDLAIAIDAPDGLFAPVLRRADAARQPAVELAALRRAVAARSLAPEALKDATFTLSNFGMIGGLHAALVVTPPQVAILGAGRITDEVRPVDGAPAIRRVLPLSLTFDHRAVTGGEAARFLAAARADLERPTAKEA